MFDIGNHIYERAYLSEDDLAGPAGVQIETQTGVQGLVNYIPRRVGRPLGEASS